MSAQGRIKPKPSTLHSTNSLYSESYKRFDEGEGVGELSKARKVPKRKGMPGYGMVSDKKKTPRKRKVRFKHLLGIVFMLYGTVAGVVIHYIATNDLLLAVIESALFIPLEIIIWRFWVKKGEIPEEKAEEIRMEKREELGKAKEQHLTIEITPPAPKKYLALSYIGVILIFLMFYLSNRDILFLVLLLIIVPIGIVGALGLYLTNKIQFTIDSFGIRRTRLYLKDFYLPWYRIKRISVGEISIPMLMFGRKNYVLRAKNDKGRNVMLMSSLPIGDEKFIELYYGIIPFLRNRNIEFEDNLGWSQ